MKQHALIPLLRRMTVQTTLPRNATSADASTWQHLRNTGAVLEYGLTYGKLIVPASPAFDPNVAPTVYLDLRPSQSFHYRHRYRVDIVGDFVVLVDQSRGFRRAFDTVADAVAYAEEESRSTTLSAPPWASPDQGHVVTLTPADIHQLIRSGGKLSAEAMRRVCESAPEVVGSLLGVPFIIAYETEGKFNPRKMKVSGASAYIRDHYSLLRALQSWRNGDTVRFHPLAIGAAQDGDATDDHWAGCVRIAPGATVVGGYMLGALHSVVLENGVQDPGSPSCPTSIELAGLMDEGLFARILERSDAVSGSGRITYRWSDTNSGTLAAQAIPSGSERIVPGGGSNLIFLASPRFAAAFEAAMQREPPTPTNLTGEFFDAPAANHDEQADATRYVRLPHDGDDASESPF